MSRRGCIGCALVVLILALVVPTLWALALQTDLPVVAEPAWDSHQTRGLAQRACFDCHSNQTVWPWYDRLPVSSWIVVLDTVRGRRALNFSEWGTAQAGGEGGEGRGGRGLARVIENGSMPPAAYILLHPDANLNAQEKQQLIQGLQNSLQQGAGN
jgi:hypothetical protein